MGALETDTGFGMARIGLELVPVWTSWMMTRTPAGNVDDVGREHEAMVC